MAWQLLSLEAPVACEIVVSGDEGSRIWKRTIRNHCRGKISAMEDPIIRKNRRFD